MEVPSEEDKRRLCLLSEKIDLRDETKNCFGENNFASFTFQFWR